MKGDIQGELEGEFLRMSVKSSELNSISGKVATRLSDCMPSMQRKPKSSQCLRPQHQ